MRRRPKPTDDDDESPATGWRVATVVTVAILTLTGVSLIAETKSINYLQAPVLERMTQAVFAETELPVANFTTPATMIDIDIDTAAVAIVPDALDPGRYPPFSCSKLLSKLKTHPQMQKKDPNRGVLKVRRTITTPPFYISLHNQTFDKTRWGIMEHGFYYERKLTAVFQQVLKESPPGARVLDVGGNIGFFTLLSASQGSFTIDAFEPNIKNRMRFCESLNINRWFRTEFNTPHTSGDEEDLGSPIVNLYPYGIGAEEGTFTFREHNNNPGQGVFLKQKVKFNSSSGLHVITLDNLARERGWFESKPHIAILKVDVEGFEPSVMAGAKELLQSHMVKNIFTEVSARFKSEREANIPFLEYLIGPAGYNLYKIGGFSGPGTAVDWPHDDQLVKKILDAAAAEGAKQLNVWWKVAEDPTTTST